MACGSFLSMHLIRQRGDHFLKPNGNQLHLSSLENFMRIKSALEIEITSYNENFLGGLVV